MSKIFRLPIGVATLLTFDIFDTDANLLLKIVDDHSAYCLQYINFLPFPSFLQLYIINRWPFCDTSIPEFVISTHSITFELEPIKVLKER